MNRYLAVIVLAGAFLSACGAGPSAEEYVDRGKAHLAAKSYGEAIAALKTAMQIDSRNAEARLLLGKAYLETHQFRAAVKELSLARDAGVPLADVAAPLARAHLGVAPRDAMQFLAELVVSVGAAAGDLPAAVRAELDLVSGLVLLHSNDPVAANARLKRVAEEHPETATASFALATAAFQEGRFADARGHLDRAFAAAPPSAEALALYANALYQEGDLDSAIDYLEQAIEKDPYSPLYRLTLVDILVKLDRMDDATATLDTFDATFKNHPRSHYFRGRIAYSRGDYSAAMTSVQRALQVLRADPASHFLAGLTAFRLGNFEQAAAHLAPVADRYTGSADFRKLYATTLLQLGETEKALSLSPAVSRHADLRDADYTKAIGTVLAGAGRFDAAGEHLAVAATLDEKDTDALRALGLIKLKQGKTDESLDAMQKALERDPDLPDAGAVEVIAHIQRNEWEQALASAGRLRDKYPDRPLVHNLLGITHAGLRELGKAEAAFRRALELEPGNPDAASNLALLLEQKGDDLGARDLLAHSARTADVGWPVYRRLSLLELKLGSVQQAVAWLQRAVEDNAGLDPEPVAALAGTHASLRDPAAALQVIASFSRAGGELTDPLLATRADAQLQTGQYGAALATLESLAKRRPDDAALHYKLARVAAQTGQHARALQSATRAYELEPDTASVKQLYAETLLRAERANDAAPLVAELTAAEPGNVDYLNLEGQLALLRGDAAAAVETFRTALEARRNSIQVRSLAAAFIKADREAEAVALLREWLEEHPEDEVTRFALADHLLARNDLEAAETQFRALTERNPDAGHYRNNLAWLLFLRGEHQAAREHAEAALRLDPTQPHWQDTLGAILVALGEFDRALEVLEPAVRALPEDRALRTNYAWALVETGNDEQAKPIIDAVLADDAAFRNRDKARELRDRLAAR